MRNATLAASIAAGILGTTAQSVLAQTQQSAADAAAPTSTQADNSRNNKLDPSNTTATADAQKDDANDRVLTQRIRQSVMADKSLSTYAHNVKIVSINGTVTLNGVVRTNQERSTIESKAAAVAGHAHVVNDLKVTSAN